MFSMHRHLGKSLAYVLFQRSTHSQVASMAARAASDKKPNDIKIPVDEGQTLATTPNKRSK